MLDPDSYTGTDYNKIRLAAIDSAAQRVPVILSREYDIDNTLTLPDGAWLHGDGGKLKQTAPLAHLVHQPKGRTIYLTGDVLVDCQGAATNFAVNMVAPQRSVIDGWVFTNHYGAVRTISQSDLPTFCPVINITSFDPMALDVFTIQISTPAGALKSIAPEITAYVYGLGSAGVRGDQIVIHGAVNPILSGEASYGKENGVTISRGTTGAIVRDFTARGNDRHGVQFGGQFGFFDLDNVTGLEVGETISQPNSSQYDATAVVDSIDGLHVELSAMTRAFDLSQPVTWPGGSGNVTRGGAALGAVARNIYCEGNGVDADNAFTDPKPLGGVYFQQAYDCMIDTAHIRDNPTGVYVNSSHAAGTDVLFTDNHNNDYAEVGQGTFSIS